MTMAEDFNMTKADDPEEAFLQELIELCKKHGFVIGACGCCDSPWIVSVEDQQSENDTIPTREELGLDPYIDPPPFKVV